MNFKDLLNEAMGQDFLPHYQPQYQLLTLTDPQDVVKHGAGTQWDTSSRFTNPSHRQYQDAMRYATIYLQKGPIYIVLKDDKPFVQMASGHPQVVSANDDTNFKIDDTLRRFLQRAVDSGQITDETLMNSIEQRVEAPGLPDLGEEI